MTVIKIMKYDLETTKMSANSFLFVLLHFTIEILCQNTLEECRIVKKNYKTIFIRLLFNKLLIKRSRRNSIPVLVITTENNMVKVLFKFIIFIHSKFMNRKTSITNLCCTTKP